ncbi:MAG TPA: hypothetical protein ENH15_06460 [Actinobacteria bacterium]|nr:hypothetical protein [Actinomycetota bacterium]
MPAVRRVRRVIRKFDPWTVFKVSLLFHAVLTVGLLLGLLILWSVIINVGVPERLDDFLTVITLLEDGDSFFNNGQQYLRVVVFLAALFSMAMTLLSTIAAILYNLISDVVGGVEVVMLEETLRLQPAAPAIRQPQAWAPVDREALTEEHRPILDSTEEVEVIEDATLASTEVIESDPLVPSQGD